LGLLQLLQALLLVGCWCCCLVLQGQHWHDESCHVLVLLRQEAAMVLLLQQHQERRCQLQQLLLLLSCEDVRSLLLLLLLLMRLRCLDLWELHWHGGSCGAAALEWPPASLLLLQRACAVVLALQAWKWKVERLVRFNPVNGDTALCRA
jgi:hypothetical protein